MAKMTPFHYVEFYDVPRCISLRYRETLFLLQSAFDEDLNAYPTSYSIYVLPWSVEDQVKTGSWKFLNSTTLTSIGNVQVLDVLYDPSKRKELDASFLDNFIADQRQDKTPD